MPRRPWYVHRFNNATSLRLILGVVPRLPRMLVPPLAGVTTALFPVRTKRERQAMIRNQRRIQGDRASAQGFNFYDLWAPATGRT